MKYKITEKYIRRGPSFRIKRPVVPIKILINKGKSNFYRTYYVSKDKLHTYKMKNFLSEVKQKYLFYDYPIRTMLYHYPIKDPLLRKHLGGYWNKDSSIASGVYYGVAWRQKARWAYTSLRKIHTGDRTVLQTAGGHFKISSKFTHQKLDDGVAIKFTNAVYKTNEKGKMVPIKSAKIEGIARNRELYITNASKYSKEDFAGFLVSMIRNFKKVTIPKKVLHKISPSAVLLGFTGSKVKEGLKEKLAEIIKKSKVLPKKKKQSILQQLERATSLNHIMNIMNKHGIIGSLSQLTKQVSRTILDHIEDDVLTFAGIDSEHNLHSYTLQRDITNDFHKGYIII